MNRENDKVARIIFTGELYKNEMRLRESSSLATCMRERETFIDELLEREREISELLEREHR